MPLCRTHGLQASPKNSLSIPKLLLIPTRRFRRFRRFCCLPRLPAAEFLSECCTVKRMFNDPTCEGVAVGMVEFQNLPVVAAINPTNALLSFKESFTNGEQQLPTWQDGTDPCGGWEGVTCTGDNVTQL